jgi:hypothetical protein
MLGREGLRPKVSWWVGEDFVGFALMTTIYITSTISHSADLWVIRLVFLSKNVVIIIVIIVVFVVFNISPPRLTTA